MDQTPTMLTEISLLKQEEVQLSTGVSSLTPTVRSIKFREITPTRCTKETTGVTGS